MPVPPARRFNMWAIAVMTGVLSWLPDNRINGPLLMIVILLGFIGQTLVDILRALGPRPDAPDEQH